MQSKQSRVLDNDPDVYCAANVLINRYGHAAIALASARVDSALRGGDLDGSTIWGSILRAAKDLLAKAGPNRAIVH